MLFLLPIESIKFYFITILEVLLIYPSVNLSVKVINKIKNSGYVHVRVRVILFNILFSSLLSFIGSIAYLFSRNIHGNENNFPSLKYIYPIHVTGEVCAGINCVALMIERLFSLIFAKFYEHEDNVTFLTFCEIISYSIIYLISVFLNITVQLSYFAIGCFFLSIILYFVNTYMQKIAFEQAKEDMRNIVSYSITEMYTILENKKLLPTFLPFLTCFLTYGIINQTALFIINYCTDERYVDLALIIHAVVLSIKTIITPTLLIIGLKIKSSSPVMEEHMLIERNRANIHFSLLAMMWS
uniref:Serpentine Receptor, class V n=1 Tax=Strongyloides venezuelensis TaxID=75913 RepID=A0A0K0G1I9_STRVS